MAFADCSVDLSLGMRQEGVAFQCVGWMGGGEQSRLWGCFGD